MSQHPTVAAAALESLQAHIAEYGPTDEWDVIASHGPHLDLGPDDGTTHIFPDWSGIQWNPAGYPTGEWLEMTPEDVAALVYDERCREMEIYMAPTAIDGGHENVVDGIAMWDEAGAGVSSGRVILAVEPTPHLMMGLPLEARMPAELIPLLSPTHCQEGVYATIDISPARAIEIIRNLGDKVDTDDADMLIARLEAM